MREDWNSFRDRNAANDRFYQAGRLSTGAGSSSVVPIDNRLFLIPHISPVRSRMVEMGVCKTQGSTSTPIRLGIYKSISNDILTPGALIMQTPAPIDTTVAGFYSMLPNLMLEEGVLYFVAFVRQGGTALGFGHNSNQVAPIWGSARPTTQIFAPVAIFTYDGMTGAMPNSLVGTTFGVNGSAVVTPMVMYQVRRP